MSELLDALQWPAMVATLLASWMVASQHRRKRSWGFWLFILSNVLWLAWGWHTRAWALMSLQLGLFVLNLRAARKNDPEKSPGPDPERAAPPGKPAGQASSRTPGRPGTRPASSSQRG
jgi:hypothetical protein